MFEVLYTDKDGNRVYVRPTSVTYSDTSSGKGKLILSYSNLLDLDEKYYEKCLMYYTTNIEFYLKRTL